MKKIYAAVFACLLGMSLLGFAQDTSSQFLYTMGFLLRLLVNAAALWVTTRIVPGVSFAGTPVALLGVAFLFGILNARSISVNRGPCGRPAAAAAARCVPGLPARARAKPG